MILSGTALLLFFSGVLSFSFPNFTFSALPTDCIEAHRTCSADPLCKELYRGLELCTGEASVPPVEEQAMSECLQRQDALLAKHPSFLACKCHRGFRKEEQCVQIYWRIHLLPVEDELERSPYDNALMDRGMASLVAASPFIQDDVENQCLKAAQDCGLYEKCGALRSEYVVACTKKISGTNRCNVQKCHRALRRFIERVPEEYSFGVLFCPCTNTACGERRRKTIVPSCAYEEIEGLQHNCLHQQSFCRKDTLCRSRLADFIQNCQPSPQATSGCLRDRERSLCLHAYAGLIGTIMTPNYIANDSADVSLWCNCKGSGNQWQECLRLQRMFTHNTCLRNAISGMGRADFPPMDITPLAPRPSPLVQDDEMLSKNHLLDRDIDLFEIQKGSRVSAWCSNKSLQHNGLA
nr:GDNF family receptor alpha-4-like [Nerophis lumbriciformis]